MELTVVVPAYNEESSIGSTVISIRKCLPKAKIIVVDDCSSDATKEIANKEGAFVVSHNANKGYGESLKTGMRMAKSKYTAFLMQTLLMTHAIFL